MIPIPSGVRVWIATGHTDMRRGMQSLALTVQESLKRDPHAGDLYIFRGRRGDLVKILWHDGIGLSLYAKRLDRGKFIWPSASDGAVSISAAQMAYMLERNRLEAPSPMCSVTVATAPSVTNGWRLHANSTTAPPKWSYVHSTSKPPASAAPCRSERLSAAVAGPNGESTRSVCIARQSGRRRHS